MIERYALILVGLYAASMTAATVIQSNRLQTAQEDNAVLVADLGEKDATIDAQNKGIKAMIDEATAQDRAIKDAGERVDALTTDLAAERAKRRAATETDYALPDCRQLLATDLAAVCPAHARRVRESARGLSRP